jgi:hypothetical protein
MNERGMRPPAFRPTRKLPQKDPADGWTALTDEQTILSCDRKIIDLHWLHERGFRHELDDEEFRNIMTMDELDSVEAQRFVERNWRTEVRVLKILGLTYKEQLQMGTLRSREVYQRVRKVDEQKAPVRRALRNRLSARGVRLHPEDVEDFVRLWVADQLSAGLGHRVIAQIHGWQRGKAPLAKQTISEKLRRMRKWTSSS